MAASSASARTAQLVGGATLLELDASSSFQLGALTCANCEPANLKQQVCKQSYSLPTHAVALNLDLPASPICQQSAINIKRSLDSIVKTCAPSLPSGGSDASPNRIRERLFRLLSKVPIQVQSERSQPAGSSKAPPADRVGEPLVIKYYHERSLAEILELHFSGLSVKTQPDQWSQHPDQAYQLGREPAGAGWQARDENARLAHDSAWPDSGVLMTGLPVPVYAHDKLAGDGRLSGANMLHTKAYDNKRQVTTTRRARRPNQVSQRRVSATSAAAAAAAAKSSAAFYQTHGEYEQSSQLGAVQDSSSYTRAPVAYDTFAYPAASDALHYSQASQADYTDANQAPFSVFSCAGSSPHPLQQAGGGGGGFVQAAPVQQLGWPTQHCQPEALVGQEMIEQQPQVACDPGSLYLASAGHSYAALAYAGPELNSASSSTCSQPSEPVGCLADFRTSFEAQQQPPPPNQLCAYSNQQAMFGEPTAAELFSFEPSQLGCVASLCEPHLHPSQMQPAPGQLVRQPAMIGQQQQ